MSQRSSHTHTTAPQGNHTNQSCGKSVPAQRKKKYFLKFSPLLKFFKPATPQPTKTGKTYTNKGLTSEDDRRSTGNSVLPQLAETCKIEAECSYQTFVQVDSEVLRNRQLRQHATRYRQRLIQKKFTHPHFVAYICKRPKEDVRLQHVLVIKTLW